MADRDENAGHRQRCFLTGHGLTQPQSGHRGLAVHRDHGVIGDELDLVVVAGAVQHDFRCPELIAAVHKRHAAGESGKKKGFFHRGVAAADDGDVLVSEEEPIAGGTGTHATAQQLLLAGNLEIACRGAHCQDDGPGAVGVSVRGHDRLDRSLQRN